MDKTYKGKMCGVRLTGIHPVPRVIPGLCRAIKSYCGFKFSWGPTVGSCAVELLSFQTSTRKEVLSVNQEHSHQALWAALSSRWRVLWMLPLWAELVKSRWTPACCVSSFLHSSPLAFWLGYSTAWWTEKIVQLCLWSVNRACQRAWSAAQRIKECILIWS